MICPGCGFDQARGSSCQQCGTHIPNQEAGKEDSRRSTPIPSKSAGSTKHRNRPLHDLDMTISMPGIPPEPPAPKQDRSKTPQEPPAKEAPPAKTPDPPREAENHSSTEEKTAQQKPSQEKPSSREQVRPPSIPPARSTPAETAHRRIVCTTTSEFAGHRIVTHHGIATSMAYLGGKILNELSRGAGDGSNLQGTPLAEEMKKAHGQALANLQAECARRGGNAVVAVSCSPVFEGGGLWLFYSGTVVTARQE